MQADPQPRRIEKFKGDENSPLPEIEDGAHIIDALLQVGPIAASGMGLGAVSWQEIKAWHEATRSSLAPHELQLLRTLSAEYLQSYDKAKALDCPPPLPIAPKTVGAAVALQANIKSMLRG